MPLTQRKIDPNNCNDSRLRILNGYRDYLRSELDDKKLSNNKEKSIEDALKVLDCARFIKINEPFLREAYFANKTDASIYSLTADGKEYVIRDFNDTALDFFIYQDKSQYPDQEKAVEICIQAHLSMVKEFEEAIETATKMTKLSQFTGYLHYEDATGCFRQRVSSGIEYAKRLKKNLLIFEDLVQDYLEKEKNANTQDVEVKQEEETKEEEFKEDRAKNRAEILKVLKYFQNYLWEECLYTSESGEAQETFITPEFIVEYFVKFLCYEDPRPPVLRRTVTPIQKNSVLPPQEMKSSTPVPQSYTIFKPEKALKCMKAERALIKNFSVPLSPVSNNDSLNFHINKLSDPVNDRPIKRLPSSAIRTRYWDPTDSQWHTRTVAPIRGGAKPAGWKHGKKESTSLWSRNGKMHFFDVKNPIFFLFDIDHCLLKKSKTTGKNKYIWLKNAFTDNKSWVAGASRYKPIPSVKLGELRADLRNHEVIGKIPYHNEILACLSKDALRGMGTQNDTLFDRLNALYVRDAVKETLNIVLPIFISPPTIGPRVYTHADQLADIETAMNSSPSNPVYKLLKKISDNPQKLVQRYREEAASLNVFNMHVSKGADDQANTILDKYRIYFTLEKTTQEAKNKAFKLAYQKQNKVFMKNLISAGLDLDSDIDDPEFKPLFIKIIELDDKELTDAALLQPINLHTLGLAIVYAAKLNNTDLTLELLKRLQAIKPFTVDQWQINGETALGFALKNENTALIEALKKAKAEESARFQCVNGNELKLKKAVLRKILAELESVNQNAADTQALQNSILFLKYLLKKSSINRFSIMDIDFLREELLRLANAEKENTYSNDLYASVGASLLALCHWFPKNETVNGVLMSHEGAQLNDINSVLTFAGFKVTKEEVRSKIKNRGSSQVFPRELDYLVEQASPIYDDGGWEPLGLEFYLFASAFGSLALLCLFGLLLVNFPALFFNINGLSSSAIIALRLSYFIAHIFPVLAISMVAFVVPYIVSYFSRFTLLTPKFDNAKNKAMLEEPNLDDEPEDGLEEKLEQNSAPGPAAAPAPQPHPANENHIEQAAGPSQQVENDTHVRVVIKTNSESDAANKPVKVEILVGPFFQQSNARVSDQEMEEKYDGDDKSLAGSITPGH